MTVPWGLHNFNECDFRWGLTFFLVSRLDGEPIHTRRISELLKERKPYVGASFNHLELWEPKETFGGSKC